MVGKLSSCTGCVQQRTLSHLSCHRRRQDQTRALELVAKLKELGVTAQLVEIAGTQIDNEVIEQKAGKASHSWTSI